MKKIALFSLTALLVAVGCQKEPDVNNGSGNEKPNPDDNQDQPTVVTFKAEVTSILQESASVTISHDGKDDDTYYGFYTSDLTADVKTLINAQAEQLRANDLSQVLWKGKTLLRPIANLTPATEYKYIVFGIKTDGELYGTEAVTGFTTLEEEKTEFTLNENWTAEYNGKNVHVSYGLVDYVSVTSKDEESYLIDVIAAADIEEYGLEETFLESVDYIQSLIDEDIASGYESSWAEYLKTGVGTDFYRLKDGVEYYVFAIGVDEEGALTGKYAQSEKFTPEATPKASEDFEKWLGYWIVTDHEDEQLPMLITSFVPDESYSVTFVNGLPGVRALFNEDKTLSLITGPVSEELEFDNFGPGTVGVYGLAQFPEGISTIIGNYTLSTMTLDETGNTATGDQTPIELKLQSGGTCTICAMGYRILLNGGGVLTYGLPDPAVPLKSMILVDSSSLSSLRVAGHKRRSARVQNRFISVEQAAAELAKAFTAAE